MVRILRIGLMARCLADSLLIFGGGVPGRSSSSVAAASAGTGESGGECGGDDDDEFHKPGARETSNGVFVSYCFCTAFP